jgi:hypothetical protein
MLLKLSENIKNLPLFTSKFIAGAVGARAAWCYDFGSGSTKMIPLFVAPAA